MTQTTDLNSFIGGLACVPQPVSCHPLLVQVLANPLERRAEDELVRGGISLEKQGRSDLTHESGSLYKVLEP